MQKCQHRRDKAWWSLIRLGSVLIWNMDLTNIKKQCLFQKYVALVASPLNIESFDWEIASYCIMIHCSLAYRKWFARLLTCCMKIEKMPPWKTGNLEFVDVHWFSYDFHIFHWVFPLPLRCPPLFGPVMKLAEFSCNESDCLLCANLLQKVNSERRDRTLNCIKFT